VVIFTGASPVVGGTEMQIEDPDGIRLILVAVPRRPPATPRPLAA
jgi:hypothetical protein